MAVNAGIYCLGVPQNDTSISFFSENFEDAGWDGDLNQIQRLDGKHSWVNYCLGVLEELKKINLAPTNGFRLIFTSDLPTSVGLSSSAALELATAHTLLQLSGHTLSKEDIVKICRQAENTFVGMPCGILDQGTSAFGKEDHLVCIECDQEKFYNLALPSETEVWVFNSGIKHDLVDSLYSTRHQECQDALECIKASNPARNSLCECTIDDLSATELPENLRKRATHVIDEQRRVGSFRQGIENNSNLADLGQLLSQSHNSSSGNFENSCEELDFLADQLNEHPSVLGARLTGGGFGGAVMAWVPKSFTQKDAETIQQAYHKQYKQKIDCFHFKASDGARKESLLSK
jgi:galactokinase